mmetsp:Transcript_13301/g.21775  ORF Transcript_13301/g.21775 Transcript_13301/m.21775 type:complete len:498 (-) Transcript_13301:1833-3326(-)|eukprot:CAMPEP_0114422770 /NCGR_PEP_ID=MMETSP0103-20121206/5787_1 /TAXON_ID=37642 ORGANISM="Paraphysomonas imperforata, Strain PA2" /NCGR_SAMPLE_ID=MMETSP0103 /ASSEMBLY_ACC=CAM_ASM_000201 /LENGTH=497 /DNA_ID=CAMNT_0001591377 /DNA_START=252 /DNA_END=1745 /DNA_ORIENTATION=+
MIHRKLRESGKQLPLTNTAEVLPQFLVAATVATPLFITCLLPCTIATQVGKFVVNKITGRKKLPAVMTADISEEQLSTITDGTKSPRNFDLILFGATGFTGRLAALYLAKTYGGSKIRWAIAGRRKEGLEKIRSELVAIDASLKDLPLIIADSSKPNTLNAMTLETKVIITTAGPFDKYGSDLVKFCAMNGTHYCDITGEADWVRKMIDKYDEAAKKSGAKIVHFCGHDCVPWDLAVSECARLLKEESGEELVKVDIYDEANSGPSGGTLATVFHSLEDRVRFKPMLGFDPMLKTVLGSKSDNKTPGNNQNFLGYSSSINKWVGPFPMAMVNVVCVKRSNAILNYGPNVEYSEATVFPSFMAGFVTIVTGLYLVTAFFFPPLLWLLKTFVLPSPGQGPSQPQLDAGFLGVTCCGKGSKGGRATVEIYFPNDPGYVDTARMLVESGLTLALENDKLETKGGIWTPAPCLGGTLLQRLVTSGSSVKSSFHTDSSKTKST